VACEQASPSGSAGAREQKNRGVLETLRKQAGDIEKEWKSNNGGAWRRLPRVKEASQSARGVRRTRRSSSTRSKRADVVFRCTAIASIGNSPRQGRQGGAFPDVGENRTGDWVCEMRRTGSSRSRSPAGQDRGRRVCGRQRSGADKIDRYLSPRVVDAFDATNDGDGQASPTEGLREGSRRTKTLSPYNRALVMGRDDARREQQRRRSRSTRRVRRWRFFLDDAKKPGDRIEWDTRRGTERGGHARRLDTG
jgi:hypothetical protein